MVAVAGCMAVALTSCGSAPTPFVVQGPDRLGNEPPTLTVELPDANTTVSQGDRFVIRWRDTDSDDNARISFSLVNTTTNERVILIAGLEENDTTGPDQVTVDSDLIPIGSYNLVGTIDDGTNAAVDSFALTAAAAVPQRLLITIVEPGTGPPTVPPTVAVIEPSFNRSVAQDDELLVVVRPSELLANANIPFDPDSDITLFVLLDLDQDPNNDDPANPDPAEIISLQQVNVVEGAFGEMEFPIRIDLATIPPRPAGEPYFIRATVDDSNNPRVHQYAVGAISVVELASGTVDLFDVGKSKSGVRWYGFSPGANLGSSISGSGDFDLDGVADFILVAQFGNPRNFGLVGEAYLIYGVDQVRFGGAIGVNSVSDTISGTIFEAPPIRNLPDARGTRCVIPGPPRSDGITDVSIVPDLTGDGRPELIFGLPLVTGAYDSMDYDPGDQDVTAGDNTADVTLVIRQGQVQVLEDDVVTNTDTTYTGVQELSIDSALPTQSFGSDVGVSWLDNGPGDRRWGLIKFEDILDQIPDDLFTIDITTVRATLELRVFNTGADAEVFQEVTGFTEQTTFNSYSVNGGEPTLGQDYVAAQTGPGSLGAFGADTAEVAEIDVSDIVIQLIDFQLFALGNELRFIIVPGDDNAADEAAFRSSEFTSERDRPTLRIEYTRTNFLGSDGCYPDDLANNRTEPDAADIFDDQFYAGGMMVYVNSENRDNDPRGDLPPDRLETTAVTLELVGQVGRTLGAAGVDQTAGGLFPRADNGDQVGRIAGARFTAGAFDCVDHLLLNQPARAGRFGRNVASIGDLNNDGLSEILISAPENEAYLADLLNTVGSQSTHFASTRFEGSIVVIPGGNYNVNFWRDIGDDDEGTGTIPTLDQQRFPPFGRCQGPPGPRDLLIPTDSFEVFAEDISDSLGGARSAGDFNQDGLDDILCGAPRNDRNNSLEDTGAAYILYGRSLLGDFRLTNADDPRIRPPMLRIRGEVPGDQIGWRQATGLDVNGDRIDDVFISSPRADFGGVIRSSCARDFNNDGVVSDADLNVSSFNNCEQNSGDEVFSDDACKAFDYDNDTDIDNDDEEVFNCLASGRTDCCDDLVNNGFVGVIFGGVFTDGDRTISQIATSDLAGAIFFGASTGHRAGYDVSSAGDFNQDGFGDILITAPGETRVDRAGRERLGVVYLIFGGTHLQNTRWSLDRVGSEDLPGIVFLSPYVKGRPNEAAPKTVAFIGDINRDGFGDIAIGNPQADFIDFSFPQGPEATDAELGRRRNAGDAYIVYGNNFGSNRGAP